MAGSADRADSPGRHAWHTGGSDVSRPELEPTGITAAGSELFARARILVVDDLDANVVLLERLLRAAGVGDVRTLVDPRLVTEYCLRWEPDLVLLDLHMPEMGGVEVLEALQRAMPADAFMPVLVLTGDCTSTAKEHALAAGAKDFVAKPINRTEVLLRVQNLLETRSLYTRLQRHKAQLQTALDQKLEQERRAVQRRRAWHSEISDVLAGGVLTMVFQPVVDLLCGDVAGVEALARFNSTPLRPPNEWFAQAAQVGLGTTLELHAVQQAITHIGFLDPDQFMSVNVSPTTATTEELRECVAVAPGNRVILELTEHVQVADYDALWPSFDELRAQGVRIAVDDAGAGYAGLQHILRLQPDIVKLDHDLTHDIHRDPARQALASAMATFAKDIGAALVAEGIENEDELDTLRDMGVPWGQGYHLARPGALPLDRRLPGVTS
jgi:EAL domain-containing protein (putative c-di-GMP-specific phosphodiesterase class I)